MRSTDMYRLHKPYVPYYNSVIHQKSDYSDEVIAKLDDIVQFIHNVFVLENSMHRPLVLVRPDKIVVQGHGEVAYKEPDVPLSESADVDT